MAGLYSKDLRERFVAALEDGMDASAAGARMRVSRATAIRWAAIWRVEGRCGAKPMDGDRRSEALEANAGTILGRVRKTPDPFLREIVARLAEREVETSQSSVARLLARHGVTRKKRR
jgi:transposase